jgi:hypothetical protein
MYTWPVSRFGMDDVVKQWHFYDKVYRIWLTLCIGSIDEFYDELDNVGYRNIEGVKARGIIKGYMIRVTPEECTTKSNLTFIWMAEFSMATLIHEVTHLVTRTFDDKGIPLSDDNTETVAYYMEYWFNEVQRARRKYPNGKRPSEAKK